MSKHLYEEIDHLHQVIERLNRKVADLEDVRDRLRVALDDCLGLLDQHYLDPAPNGQIARGRAALEASQ